MTSKLLFQIVLGVLGVIPIVTALPAALRGLPRVDAVSPGLDSDHRYWAAIFAALGVGFYLLIPGIATNTLAFRILAGTIVIGGLARLPPIVTGRYRTPSRVKGALFLELVGIPLLVVWQASL